jgi:hypothetical protein
MPSMPRPDVKAKKIAYKLLGKPANLAFKPTSEQRRINTLLIQEQLTRTR